MKAILRKAVGDVKNKGEKVRSFRQRKKYCPDGHSKISRSTGFTWNEGIERKGDHDFC